MQTAMRPQIGIQRAPPPRPLPGQVGTTSQGLITRGGSLQAAVMPGPAMQSGYAARGAAMPSMPGSAMPGISAPMYKPAQPAGQAYGFQAASPTPANYAPMMRTMAAAPAGVQKPATLSAYTATGSPAGTIAPKPAMALAPRGGSTAVPTGFTAPAATATPLMTRSALPARGTLSAATVPRAAKPFTATPLLEKRLDLTNSENNYGSYPRIAAPEKVDKVGPVQSPLPLRQRNVADPGSMAPVRSPMAPQRLLPTEALPARTPVVPRQMSGPRESKLEPPKRIDIYEPPKAAEFIPAVQEPPALVPQQPLNVPAPCTVAEAITQEAALPEADLAFPADPMELREPQGAFSDPMNLMDEQPTLAPMQVEEQPTLMVPPVFQSQSAGDAGFYWQLIHAHPMVMEEEKVFIAEALEQLNAEIAQFGGVVQYMFSNYADYVSETMPVEELLQLAFLACFQEKSRNGQDTINIQIGTGFSMGMKKVVKLEVQLQEPEDQQLVLLAILWDWDVKLEWRGIHADE
mmetsp:Transcript_2636/g.4864  ORF Transcript_2636/g.4864 Transcript_2636/m.4864 type:complete len:518 (+) Transcript_2636:87-1640(+)